MSLSRTCRAFFLVVLICTVSCTQNVEDSHPNYEQPESAPGFVAVFYAPLTRGDLSYTDMLSAGVNSAAIKHNLLLAQYEPEDLEHVSSSFSQVLSLCDRKLKENSKAVIIFASPSYKAFISANSSKISEYAAKGVVFILGESKEISNPDVHTFDMPFYGVNYEAGVAADTLLESNEKALILLSDAENEIIRKSAEAFLAGFCASEKHGNESNVIWGNLLSEVLDNWTEESKIENALVAPILESSATYTNLSETLYIFAKIEEHKTLGVNLILPYCGGSVLGLLLYNRENPDSFYTVGTDVDMQAYSEQVPFSIVKHIDRAIENCISSAIAGTLPKHKNFGLKDGYTEIVVSSKCRLLNELEEAVRNARSTAIEKEAAYENANANQ